jgi:thymidine kinase
MKAGKSETIKSRLSVHNAMGHKCILISSCMDTRAETGELDSKGVLTSHDPCSSVLSNRILQTKAKRLSEITKQELDEHDVIGIDESQFFPDIILVLDWIRIKHKTVYLAGLMETSEGSMFGEYYKLLPFADERVHLKACCPACQAEISHRHIFTPATMSKCLVKKDSEVLVGAKQFIPLCHRHWVQWDIYGWVYDHETGSASRHKLSPQK